MTTQEGKKRERSALFFDIDGTILSEKTGEIPESTRKAFAMARENGHELFLNTGRTICGIQDILEQLDVSGSLCGCGTYIIYHDQVLFSKIFSKEQSKRYLKLMKQCKVEGVLEGEKKSYFYEPEKRCPMMRMAEEVYQGYEEWEGSELSEDSRYSKMFVCVDEQSDKDTFFREVGKEMEIIDRLYGSYECIWKGYSKGTAIEYVREYLGMTKDQIYVFGDSSNDLGMFEYAVHTVAMGEHNPVLDPYTEYVTDTVENDGIYKAMEHYGLI